MTGNFARTEQFLGLLAPLEDLAVTTGLFAALASGVRLALAGRDGGAVSSTCSSAVWEKWFIEHGYPIAPYDDTGNVPGGTGVASGGGRNLGALALVSRLRWRRQRSAKSTSARAARWLIIPLQALIGDLPALGQLGAANERVRRTKPSAAEQRELFMRHVVIGVTAFAAFAAFGSAYAAAPKSPHHGSTAVTSSSQPATSLSYNGRATARPVTENTGVAGATGRTIVQGDDSTIAGDDAATRIQRTESFGN